MGPIISQKTITLPKARNAHVRLIRADLEMIGFTAG